MLHVITCTPIAPAKLSKFEEEFCLVHLSMGLIPPMNRAVDKFRMHYRRDPSKTMTDYLGGYVGDGETIFEKTEHENLSDAIDVVADAIGETLSSDDEPMIVSAVHESWSTRLVQRIDKRLEKKQLEGRAVDVHKLLKKPTQRAVEDYLKMISGSQNIFQDDPVNFSYAIYQLMSGRFR